MRKLLFLAAALTPACTSISTLPDLTRSDLTGADMHNRGAIEGVPYALPMLNYKLSFVYSLEKCDPGESFKFGVSIDGEENIRIGERYVVHYEDLSSVWKTSLFGVKTYEETGTLKSMNVAAEDKTGDVLKSTAKLALAAAGIPPATAAGAETANAALADLKASPAYIERTLVITPLAVQCTNEAKRLIDARKAAKDDLEDAADKLAAVTQEIELLKLTVKFADPASATAAIHALITKKRAAEKDRADAQEKLDDANKALTLTVSRAWPEEFHEFHKAFNDDAAIAAWIDGRAKQQKPPLFEPKDGAAGPDGGLFVPAPCGGFSISERINAIKSKPIANHQNVGVDVAKCLAEIAASAASLVETNGEAPCAGNATGPECRLRAASDDITLARDIGSENAKDKGVFVRPPVSGELRVCSAANVEMITGTTQARCKDGDKLSKHATVIPQLGQLRMLPFSNGPFENNALSLELSQKGHLLSFDYKRSAAAAAAAAGAAADIASQIEAFTDERAAERQKAADAAKAEGAAARADEIAALDHDIAVLEKNKKLLELQSPDPDSAAAAETASLQAEIALLKARQELLALQQQINN